MCCSFFADSGVVLVQPSRLRMVADTALLVVTVSTPPLPAACLADNIPLGVGKSTLLRHIALREVPIPAHISILFVEQEVCDIPGCSA